MTPVKYRVYLSADTSIALEASKVNTGELRLWFFDQNNNLIALFKWAEILGFTVEGPVEGQILTDKIPIEMGKVPDEELGVKGRLYLESARERLADLAEIPL